MNSISNEKAFELPRSLYKELKAMNREQMQNVLTDIYRQGAEIVETASVDLDELRKAIGNINGIGDKRLDEIMRVIDEFVNK